MSVRAEIAARGWARFPTEPATLAWARAASTVADAIMADPQTERRHGGTWLPGVDALPSDPQGRLGAGPPLLGTAMDAAADLIGGREVDLRAGQLSVCLPGYPRRGAQESEAAHRFRRNRDAAHVDGLLPVGADRRRFALERHGFVLGVALPPAVDAAASPLVVWSGSHEHIRRALRAAFDGVAPDRWPEIDVTDAYQSARRGCFDDLERTLVPLAPGEAVLLHRLTLHGVAPWRSDGDQPRRIAYFRPDPRPCDIGWWLLDP